MKRGRAFTLLLATSALAALLWACSSVSTDDFTSIADDPQPLIAGLVSYLSPAEAKKTLGNPAWKVTVNHSLPPGDTRPPFNILVVSIPDFTEHGQKGTLELHFFNSRLMAVCFSPSDSKAYEKACNDYVLLRLPPMNGEFTKRPYLKIHHGVDHQGREYFRWADQRLEEQNFNWIARYS